MVRYGFETLKLDLISICRCSDNARTRRVIEKCGFRYEGLLRRSEELYDGEIKDELLCSLTREEFEATGGRNAPLSL